jgi:hypothetical protein
LYLAPTEMAANFGFKTSNIPEFKPVC